MAVRRGASDGAARLWHLHGAVESRLDRLDRNVIAAPLFIHADLNNEIDNEYSGSGGNIPAPFNAQFVAQPFTL
jgi:hypothetical protein